MAHILVVEDEPMIAEGLAVLIEDLGDQVTVTGMLEEALRPAADAPVLQKPFPMTSLEALVNEVLPA